MTPAHRILAALLVSAFVASVPCAAPAVAVARIAAPIVLTPALREYLARNAIAAKRIDVPQAFRKLNWVAGRQGSCVHASTFHLLHWQGQPQLAAWWKATHGGGAGPQSVATDMQSAGIDYAETTAGDVAFLEWAIRTRRAANVTQQGGWHMVTLVGLDSETATILDSNYPDRLISKPRSAFLADWRTSQNNLNAGWAFTTLFQPPAPPPKPWKILTAFKE